MKTLEEIMLDFDAMCGSHRCIDCEYKNLETSRECRIAYLYDQLADARLGKETSTSSAPTCQPRQNGANTPPKPATADKTEAVQPPKWCKVGAWVMSPGGRIGQLVDWQAPCTALVKLGDIETPFQFSDFDVKPIRFRPYTFEEVEQLLGKKVVATSITNHSKWTMLITEVSLCDLLEDAPRINNYRQSYLILCNATIDGVPIGVPEVDEALLKGGEE